MMGLDTARRTGGSWLRSVRPGARAACVLAALVLGACSNDKGSSDDSAVTSGSDSGGGGSGSTKTSAGRPAPVSGPKAPYVELYEQGHYQRAKVEAEDAAAASKGAARDQALVVAGMCAHAMNDDAEAERILRPLATNSDMRVAGRAKATLGLIAQEKNKDEEASQLLLDASRQLAGDESARASLHAGDSLVKLNHPEKARIQYQIGLASAKDPELRKDLQQRIAGASGPGSTPTGGLAGGGFTIQLGAFTQKANADKTAQAAAGKASSAGMSPPRVVKGTDSKGREVWFVWVGQFGSRQAAANARTKIGQGVIVPAKA